MKHCQIRLLTEDQKKHYPNSELCIEVNEYERPHTWKENMRNMNWLSSCKVYPIKKEDVMSFTNYLLDNGIARNYNDLPVNFPFDKVEINKEYLSGYISYMSPKGIVTDPPVVIEYATLSPSKEESQEWQREELQLFALTYKNCKVFGKTINQALDEFQSKYTLIKK